jgi:hypothetical protein
MTKTRSMHDYILGFVCFMAGALFVAIIGVPLLEAAPRASAPSPRGCRRATRRTSAVAVARS